MYTTDQDILSHIMSQADIEATKANLLKLGQEDSKERQCAFGLMALGTLLNKFRFHDQADKLDYCSCAEQFLLQLKATKDTYNLNNNRINDGLNWLKENGFEYLYGLTDIEPVAQEAFNVLNKRSEYLADAKKSSASKAMTEKEANKRMKREVRDWDGDGE